MKDSKIEYALKALAEQAPRTPSALTEQIIAKLRLYREIQAQRSNQKGTEIHQKEPKPPEQTHNKPAHKKPAL